MRRAGTFAVLLAALGTAAAQQRPDAGSTLRETQQPIPAPARPAPPAPRIEGFERPALTAPAAARFQVKAIRVTGATAFPAAQLEELVQEFTGKELGLSDLQEAAARITRYYRERGYPVARAYLPAQEVRDGTVEIAVLEGRYGRFELQNRSRVNDATVQRHTGGLQAGGAIEGGRLERALLLLSDLPGIAAPDAALRPGAQTGESDLVVALEPAPLASGSAELDNHGNRFTGQWRASGSVALASPTGYGDQFSARLTTTGNGLTSTRAAYQLPVGGSGLRLGAAYSNTDYHIGKDFSALDASGEATVTTLNASYPFVRSLGVNLSGLLSWDAKRLEDRVGSAGTVAPKRNDALTAGLSGNWLDTGGKASNSYSVALVSGRLRIDSAAAQQTDDSGPRARGSFSKVNYALSRLQTLGDTLTGYLSLSGQQAGKNLDSSEKFLLGGPYGVRAYPQGEAAGDDGFLFTAELRWRVPQAAVANLELIALLDHGETRINHDAFATGRNTRRISGAGIGVNLAAAQGWLLRSAWSWRTGHEPATSDTPRSGRGWLQLVKFF